MLDYCSFKTVYLLQFSKSLSKKKILKGHQNFRVTASLIGKYDIICPNLYESTFVNGQNAHLIVNQQVKMIPNFKSVIGNETLFRDGFSLLIDQVRFDFDYKYFSNAPNRENIRYCLQNKSSVFEYEHNFTKKIKKNINPENSCDEDFYRFLVIKVKMREEILQNNVYTENQKLKLLDYFSKTIQGHSRLSYSQLFSQASSKMPMSEEYVAQMIQPRSELYGASMLSFLSLDQKLVEQCIEILQENQE